MSSVPGKSSWLNEPSKMSSEKTAVYSLLNGIYAKPKSYESSSGPMMNMGIDVVTNPEPIGASRMQNRFSRNAS